MAKKYFSEQFDNEEVLLVFNKHPLVMRRELVIASFALLLGVVPGLVKPTYVVFFGGLAIGFVLASLIMFYAWMNWYFSVYIVTDQRLIQVTHHGLWKHSNVDIGLDKIQAISYEVSGFQQALLGSGTIVIQTYIGELVINNVHHPKKIQKRLSQIQRDLGFNTTVPSVIESDENVQKKA
jgi:uncharacterized membrane protein YdbT with pleckstrin-like domain